MTNSISKDKLDRIRKRSPLNKLVDPSDVAGIVNYLLADRAKTITGTVFTIDAGSTT